MKWFSLFGAWLSLARAPGSGPGGRWFESTRPDQSSCPRSPPSRPRTESRVRGLRPGERWLELASRYNERGCSEALSIIALRKAMRAGMVGGDLLNGSHTCLGNAEAMAVSC